MGLSQHPLLLFVRHLLQRDLAALRAGIDVGNIATAGKLIETTFRSPLLLIF